MVKLPGTRWAPNPIWLGVLVRVRSLDRDTHIGRMLGDLEWMTFPQANQFQKPRKTCSRPCFSTFRENLTLISKVRLGFCCVSHLVLGAALRQTWQQFQGRYAACEAMMPSLTDWNSTVINDINSIQLLLAFLIWLTPTPEFPQEVKDKSSALSCIPPRMNNWICQSSTPRVTPHPTKPLACSKSPQWSNSAIALSLKQASKHHWHSCTDICVYLQI